VKRKLFIIVLLVAVLGGTGYWLFRQNQAAAKKNQLRLSGHIEATQTDLAFKVSGKIVKIYFQEGDWVRTGQKVAELDAQDLKNEVDQAKAKVGAARANLDKLMAGYRPQEIKEAKADVDRARADLVDRKLDFDRYQILFQRKVVAATTRDKYEANYLMAQATLKGAREKYDMLKEGYRREDIDKARAELQQAQATLDLAETRLGYATILSPVDGAVLVKPAEVGEVAAVGSNVLTLGLLDDIWFEGYIPETDLVRVKLHQRAIITTDSYPGKQYPAWVSYISSKAEFTPKTVETFKERVTLVYRTKIRADNPNHELRPGMPAEAVVFFDNQHK
jgi:HlyD family secretion protein